MHYRPVPADIAIIGEYPQTSHYRPVPRYGHYRKTTITAKYLLIPSITAQYLQITTITAQYLQITTITAQYLQITTITAQYLQTPSFTGQYLQTPSITGQYLQTPSITVHYLQTPSLAVHYLQTPSLTVKYLLKKKLSSFEIFRVMNFVAWERKIFAASTARAPAQLSTDLNFQVRKMATNQQSRLVEKSVHETESSSSSSEGDDKVHDLEDEVFQALYETPTGMKKTVTFSSVS
ncbi:hypothetical protein Hamer_G025210 [Homarus americanus]|uniref:Uncharacterized protein n=1 Tax=Homarus americanus TaxID=6706 RepID=A0A8J5JJK3_HOMAM|nr:hypothetical protein Hamer_G025210 [Homarus americanus]